MTQWVFLVGGMGTRLGTLTRDVPKPLLPVAGRPFLDHLMDRAVALGASEIVLLAGYLADRIADAYAKTSWNGVPIRCVVEPSPLGTAGALANAAPLLADRWILANGDTLFDIDPRGLGAQTGPWLVAMALRAVADTGRSGTVTLENGWVRRFAPRGDGGPGLINAGTYAMRREILDHIPAGRSCSLEDEVLPLLVGRSLVAGTALDGYFIDIGIPEDLARAQTEVPGIAARGAARI